MSKFPVSCIGIIERDNQFLMVKEGKAGAEGEWALPGGGLEGEESLEECVLREIEEETGLESEIENYQGLYVLDISGKKMFVHVFTCQSDGNISPQSSDTVMDAEFISQSRLENIDLRFSEMEELLNDYRKDINPKLRYLN